MEWQPIDNPPKHWGFYLAWFGWGDVCILQYQPFDGGTDGKKANNWYDENDFPWEPTHWMPLPPPPSE